MDFTLINFWNYIFITATAVSAFGLIFIIYSRSTRNITSKLFIITLTLVIAYLISHTVHFVMMPATDVTLFDQSCHTLLLMILLSITFLTFNFPYPQKIGIISGLSIIVPSTVIMILLWSENLIYVSYAHEEHFTARFTSLYIFYVIWYFLLIIININSLIIKYKKYSDTEIRKQLLLYLFGLIITNTTTFIFGILLPWILGLYYLVEISPLAFLIGFIFFTSIAIGRYNLLPAAAQRVNALSLNKKIFFAAIVLIPIIILLILIPLSRVFLKIDSYNSLINFFVNSIFIGLAVSLILSFIVSRIITNPISLLKEKVLQIESGNYDVKVDINSADEIGELADAINKMAFTLSKNRAELSRREERISILLNAFEKSPAAITVVDNNFNITEANVKFFELTETQNNKDRSKKINELQFHTIQEEFDKIINEVNNKGFYSGEIKLKDKTGNKKDLLLSITKIYSADNIEKGYLFVEIDITDRKRMEAEISKAEKLSALGKMSAILAHEIKTPLTSIKMNIDMLGKSLHLNSLDKESFDIIKKETERLTNLVKDVLQFSRTTDLFISKVNLYQFISEVFQQAKINTSNKQITFINKTNDVTLEVDPDKFKQVLLNLIQNSIDAIINKGIIELSSKINESSISIYIRDNGIGIEDPENIFDSFFTTKISGTGLGLSVSQKIIEQHKGTLKLISGEKENTIFEIKLPLNN
ncbi:sensor histidine kinase [Stygiobacter electus]|uniref:histidine kinase n=1 Tax=Stygiobacter electus TaxID=3032292 RepID=A0AAE3P1Y4_9BACT|nr:ATP-binding protein [Stygiobacter electus]MDF1612844.1 ATP-binding protein [Stygiobacter electus]